MYPQQTPSNDTPYWLQDTVPAQENTLGYNLPNQVPQEAAYPDFPPFAGELFQPEEIFQLDQPLRPDFPMNSQDPAARSPPTLLDLGSGTIKYEIKQHQDQSYWNQFLSEDSSSSHLSMPQDDRLQFPGFEEAKETNGFCSKRPVNQFVPEKDTAQNHPLNNALNFQDYQRTQNHKSFVDGQVKSDQESYWGQNHHDERLNFPGFDPQKEQDLLASRRDVNCFPKENCQPGLLETGNYNVYPKKENGMAEAARPSRSPIENKQYAYDGYNQMFDHSDSKSQLSSRSHQNSNRMVLDERLQNNYGGHEANPDSTERLFPDSTGMEASMQPQSSPEPFFYPSNDRCHYTCEVLDTRLPQMTMNADVAQPGINAYGDVSDLDLPPFVDYTLVGMLCSSTEEDTSNLLPGCPQNAQSYVPHH